MGIAKHYSFIFLGCLLSMAFLVLPNSSHMNTLLRASRWIGYSQRESTRAWNQNRHDKEAAITLIEALRQQGRVVEAIHIGRAALQRHAPQPAIEHLLLSLYNENYDFESLAQLHNQLWVAGRAQPESLEFLHSYYRQRQMWGPLGQLLEKEYALRQDRGQLPWDLIAFYERQKDLGRLESLYTQRLRSHPNDAEALAGLISVYQTLDEREALAALYEQFLETSPDHLDTINNLIALYEEESVPADLTLYARRTKLRPANIDYGLAYLEELRRTGNRDLALDELTRLSRLAHPSESQLSTMAYIASEESWNDLAIPLTLRAAETLEPSAPWWESAGILSLKNGHEQTAKDYFEKAFSENPRQGDVARTLAEISFRQGDPQKAAHYWDQWLSAHPDDRAARLMIGDTLSIYDRNKAESLYREGLAIERTRSAADEFAYAALLLRVHRTKEAYAAFKQLEKSGRHFESPEWADLSYLAIQSNELQAAQKYLEQFEKVSPGSDRGTLLRSQLLLAQNRPLEALPLLERLTQKNSQETDLKADLAWVYSQLGNWTQAEKIYQDLLTSKRQVEAERMLWEIQTAHHARIDVESSLRLGPGSKEEWVAGVAYRSKTIRDWQFSAEQKTHALARRRPRFNEHVMDWVQNLSAGGKIERRRWKMETALSGFFGDKVKVVAPEGAVTYRANETLFTLSGQWKAPILDPSEALDVRGRQAIIRIETSKRWNRWNGRLSAVRRTFSVDGSRNSVTREAELGTDWSGEIGISRILSESSPYSSVGYSFISSHWQKPFPQAETLIPWLDNQRTHQAQWYVEERTNHRFWDVISAGTSGGRDVARQTWLFNIGADISGRIKQLWRWSLGAGWAKDSGVVGSGSSTTVRAKISRYMGNSKSPLEVTNPRPSAEPSKVGD